MPRSRIIRCSIVCINEAMSLFQVHEWWRSSQLEPEECGSGCLCVANIDNAPDNASKVVVGSYTGILHIYLPQNESNTNLPSSNLYSCLLEVNLQNPVLQVAAGRFMSLSSDIYLAVLHPRLLSVYKFKNTLGGSDQLNEYQNELQYQHKLERSAVNMTWGQFGEVKDRDFICVQSLDGALSVFEQETFAFTRFLPGFLLPGPIAYNRHADVFLTVSSSYVLEAYSYQVLAVASDAKSKEESQAVSKGKRIEADWTYNLGEYGFEVKVVEFQDRKPLIAVLGERSLFCFESLGRLVFMRRFEESVACLKTGSTDGGSLQTIVCTHSKQLLIFHNAQMKWGAKLNNVPIAIETGSFRGCEGGLVLLDDDCQTSCHYLGTAPAVFALPRSQQRDMTHDRIDAELANIKQQIVEHNASEGDNLASKNVKEDLKISVVVPKHLDRTSVASQHVKSSADQFPSITIQVSLKASRRITDVQLMIPSSKPMYSSLPNFCIPAITEFEHPPTVRSSFFLEERALPSSLDQMITVCYKQAAGHPQVMTTHLRLPLPLVAAAGSPVKKLGHRATIDSNKPCVNLMELFPDFVCDESGPNCIGVDYRNGFKATVLTSKTSNRYRVQSDEYDGLWLITDELLHRIHLQHPDIHVSCQEPPQLEEFVQFIDEHFRLRQSEEEIRSLLQQRAHQYRAIQRRLLTRFKDKTPQPLNCLDTLLEGTHTQLLALCDAIEETNSLLRSSSVRLSSSCRLLVLLTRLWRGLSDEEADFLSSVLSVEHTYSRSNAVGWEETVDSALTILLKTNLSKAEGGIPFTSPSNALDTPQDTVKVKKHLAILVDRLNKGGRLLSSSTITTSRRSEMTKKFEQSRDEISIDDSNHAMDLLPPEGEVRTPQPMPRYDVSTDELSQPGKLPPSSVKRASLSEDLETSYYDDDYRDIFAD